MPQVDRQIFSLYQVARSIQTTISKRYNTAYWIQAEMNKLNFYQHSGHCYPELVEKKDGKVIAEMRSTLWRADYQRINARFESVLNEPLKDGIKILFQATITFDPKYGMSLHILDIDPNYTLGDLEKEKQETIKKLQKEDIFDANKMIELALLPQRVAIISVETSKGYADFLRVFESAKHNWNYEFFHMLFPSLLQGDNAVQDMIRQLHRIKKVVRHFDVVAIVRGGGGDIGLSCYNHYELAKEIALFPIPVITGIGHATNLTVAEMIAHENAITPTKLAEFLVQKFHNFSVPVKEAESRIIDLSRRIIEDSNYRFQSEISLFQSATRRHLERSQRDMSELTEDLIYWTRQSIKESNEFISNAGIKLKNGTLRLAQVMRKVLGESSLTLRKDSNSILRESQLHVGNVEKNIQNMSPEKVLMRGYSITMHKGKALKSADQLEKGDTLQTRLHTGSVESTVGSIEKKK